MEKKSGQREIKAGLGYTVGNILIKGITFITLPIFSRLLTTSQFGIYTTYMAYENTLAIILGLGMYASIKNAKIDYPDRVNQYTSTLLWLTVIPLCVCFILIIAFPQWLSQLLDLSQGLLLLLVFQSYGTAMLSVSNSRLALDYNYGKYMGFAAFNTIMNIGLSILLILTFFNNQREYGRILGSAIPLVIIGLFVFITNQRAGKFSFDKKMAKYAFSVGFPLIWHYLSQQIQNQFDRIAITNIVGSSFTGIYSFAFSIATILNVIFYSTENVWSVWMFGKMAEGDYKKIRDVSKKYMLLISTIAILMLVGSREVIMIMGDKSYWEGQVIFIPLLISIYLLYLYTIPVGIEYYYKQTKYIALMTAIAAAINVSLNYALIPRYGYIAAAYTTMLSHAVQFIAHWFISKRILQKEGINTVFYFSDLMKVFVAVCICGVAVAFLNPYPVIKYVVFVVLFVFGMYFYRDDLKMLVDMFLKKKKAQL